MKKALPQKKKKKEVKEALPGHMRVNEAFQSKVAPHAGQLVDATLVSMKDSVIIGTTKDPRIKEEKAEDVKAEKDDEGKKKKAKKRSATDAATSENQTATDSIRKNLRLGDVKQAQTSLKRLDEYSTSKTYAS